MNQLNDTTLLWRHNGRDGVSNHQPHHCLLKRLFRHRSKKTPMLRFTGLSAGNSPHKWPVTRKMFPFNDVIMTYNSAILRSINWMLQTPMPCIFHIALISHYSDVIKGAMASHITSVSIVYSTVCSGGNQRNHQSSVSLAFVRRIHPGDRWISRTKGQ